MNDENKDETLITQELINKLLEIFTSTTTDNSSNTFLDHISEIDSDKIVKYLIETGFDVNAKDSQGETAIIKAILNNNEKIVRILIKCGAIIDHTYYPNYNGPLHVAAEKYVELTKMLVDAGCDVNAKNKIEITPLIAAIRIGNIKTAKILLDAGASRDHTFYRRNNGPLHVACRLSNIDMIKLLINSGYDVSAVNENQSTPLLVMVEQSYCDAIKTEIAKVLIEAGSDVNAKNIIDNTPLMIAIRLGDIRTAKILLDAGASRDHTFYKSMSAPLHLACRHSKLEMVKLLVESGYDVSAVNDCNSPLYFTVHSKSKNVPDEVKSDIIKILIQAGADINAKNEHNLTVLHRAVYANSSLIVDLLLKSGADPNIFSIKGNTPLKIALGKSAHYFLIRRLIESGADVNLPDRHGRHSVFYAAGSALIEVLHLLKKHGATLNSIDKNGDDPLRYALKFCHGDNVRAFKEYYLRERNLRNLNFDSAIDNTLGKDKIENQIECVKMLYKYCAKKNNTKQNDFLQIETTYFKRNHSKIIYTLMCESDVVNFGLFDTMWMVFRGDPFANCPLKIERLSIRFAAIRNSYKNGKGIINFDYEKLNEELGQYYKDCVKELEKLKNCLVYESMPLSNLIEGPVSSSYILNENLIEMFESDFIAKTYPICSDMLIERFQKEREKYELLLDATAGLQRLINFNDGSFNLIHHNILKYLETKDQRIVALFANTETSELTSQS